jgi:endonuclease-8
LPDGDTIHRAARTLHSALAGRTVVGFESVFPRLSRIEDDQPLRGRTIESVEARGKHLLIGFSGGLVLRTHMRMHGSWHIYRPGERWQRPRHEMRIVLRTEAFEAVAFNVPVAEFATAGDLARTPAIRDLGPDPLDPAFDGSAAIERLISRGEMEVADALLDQTAIAGIGNVYKSEILFAARVNPFTRVNALTHEQVARLVELAVHFMRANAGTASPAAIITYSGLRRTTGRADPSARLWVYRRAGQPCRRCGSLVLRARQGPHVRSTYWCERCQIPNPKPQIPNPNPNPQM